MDNQELTSTGVRCGECGRTFLNTQGLGSHRVFTHKRPTTSKTQARGSRAPGERHIPPAGPATPAVQVWPSSSETVASGHIYGVVLLFYAATPHTYRQLQQIPLYSTPTSLMASPLFRATTTSGQGSLVSPTTDDANRTDHPEPLTEWEEQDLIDWLTGQIDG